MSYSTGIGKRGEFKPLTLEDLDRMPGMHHVGRGEKRDKMESSDQKVDAVAKKTKKTIVKECTNCHKKYSVTFKSPERAKADYVCRKCLSAQ
jgi:hypothetical protein